MKKSVLLCGLLCVAVGMNALAASSDEKEKKRREREAQQQQLQEQRRQQEKAERARQMQAERERRLQQEEEQRRARIEQERQQAERRRQRELEEQKQKEVQRRQRELDYQREIERRRQEMAEQKQRDEQQRRLTTQKQAPVTATNPVAAPVAARAGSPTGVVTPMTAPTTAHAPVSAAAPTSGVAPSTSAPAAMPLSAPSPGYAAAPAGNMMGNQAKPLTQCLLEKFDNGTYRLANNCNVVVNAAYCVAVDGNTIPCSDSYIARRALKPQESATQSYSTKSSVRSYYMACPEGYKPKVAGWSGNTLQGSCELSGEFSLLKDWTPMETAALGGVPTLELCIRDNECEDGDILSVSVNNREVMREEIFNKATCKRAPVMAGNNIISIYAVNGTGYKGNCGHQNKNTGEITVYGVDANGNRTGQQTQTWEVPGGAGSSSSMRVVVR